ncbi:uncharacterized protein [Danio rerio]|uniref:Uncharacterized protein n=1 Tax=Danio rerio TaxID=7955 RepID=A0AC58GM98_DANRE
MTDYKKRDISVVVYECVSRPEFHNKDSETAEMMLDISDGMIDQDFFTETNIYQQLKHTGSDSAKKRIFRRAPVYLMLLCFLLLTAVILLSVYNYQREVVLNNIHNLTEEKDPILTKMTNLTQLNNQLNREKDKLLEKFNGTDGWFYYQSSLYFISSEKKSWSESRRYCTDSRGDLIIINSREEQNFVMKKAGLSGAWIGLTDHEKVGIWKWVDGSTLTTGIWASGQPNAQTEANCVTLISSSWYNKLCTDKMKWVCEKNIF